METLIGQGSDDVSEAALAQLLDHRYGDGLVYLRDQAERSIYQAAIHLGLINADGYVTPEGRALLARCGDN